MGAMAEDAFREKIQSIGFGMKHRGKTRSITDEHNNTVTQHWDGRQDVLIRAPRVVASLSQKEER